MRTAASCGLVSTFDELIAYALAASGSVTSNYFTASTNPKFQVWGRSGCSVDWWSKCLPERQHVGGGHPEDSPMICSSQCHSKMFCSGGGEGVCFPRKILDFTSS